MSRNLCTFEDILIDNNILFYFYSSLRKYSLLSRRPAKQIITLTELLSDPNPKRQLTWVEIDIAFNWVHQSGIELKRKSFMERLRKKCMEMCWTIDESTNTVYNPDFLIFERCDNNGITPKKLHTYNSKPINDLVRSKLGKQFSILQRNAISKNIGDKDANDFGLLAKILNVDEKERIITIGKYRILYELGSGNIGHVYHAIHSETSTHVALKVLKQSVTNDSKLLNRFFNATKLVCGLAHKNIINILDIGEIRNGVAYYSMEYIDGTDLGETIRKNALSITERIDILTKIVDGLEYIHSNNLVHRDLKPENILIGSDGTVKLSDFDSAYMPASAALTTTIVPGTLHYMSPERRELSDSRDPDDDVFAFGMIALELLTGRIGESRDNLLEKSISIEEIPDLLKIVLSRCILNRSEGRLANGMLLHKNWNNSINEKSKLNKISPVLREREQTNYSGKIIFGKSFRHRYLARYNFRYAKLVHCDFSFSVLSNSIFQGAVIDNCNFDGAFAFGMRMQQAQITSSSFRLANLERSVWENNLSCIDFTGANFWGADIAGCSNLDNAILERANFSRTRLSHVQETLIRYSINITHADDYHDYLLMAKKFYNNNLPQELWWLLLIDSDHDSFVTNFY